MSKVSDPNAKSGNGFIWGVGVLLVIIAVVIGYIVWNGKQADEIEVHLGALDEPDQLTPTYECWTVRREAWLPAFPLNRRYPHDRDDSSRFE